jgi:hypothetical protein
MEPQDVDALITEKTVKSCVKGKAFSINIPSSCSGLSPYVYSKAAADWKEGDLTGIYTALISLTLSGSRDSLDGFKDYICRLDSARIASFIWSPSDNKKCILTLNLEL